MAMQAAEDHKRLKKVVNWSPVELEVIQFGQPTWVFLAVHCFAYCCSFLRTIH